MIPELKILASYLAGEFDNREQALEEPIWYVGLRLWQVPIPLFNQDSVTFFLEQANFLELDRPYRQRVLRLFPGDGVNCAIAGQYYQLKDPVTVAGGGCNPKLLEQLTPESITALPGCLLNISCRQIASNQYEFSATQTPGCQCSFIYGEKTIYVALGFDINPVELKTYDRGLDPETGRATWGAIMGPYRYTKRKQLSETT